MSTRFQTVGSLLRPESLLSFKREIEHRDDITYPFYQDLPVYEQAEAAATADVVAAQIAHHLSVVTDGEYSKSLWHLDFVWGLSGIHRFITDHGYFFRDHDGEGKFETRRDIGITITAPLHARGHHFIDVFRRLQTLAPDQTLKQCIPSPSHIYGELTLFDSVLERNDIYRTPDELKQGLVSAYTEFLDDYAAAGGTIIQLDDCLWELFADDNPNSPFTGQAVDQAQVQALAADFIEINNAVIAHAHALGLQAWTHNCRGNYSSRNMGGGSYVRIADLFLKQLTYDRFFLEWDDDRAGSTEALRVFQDKPDTEIVLGLLSSKTRTLDDEQRVIHLLDEASTILPRERLLLSHQCGFASTDEGNELTAAEQWAKIDQGQRIAEQYWGE